MVDMPLLHQDSLNHQTIASGLFQEAVQLFMAERSIQPVYTHLLRQTADLLDAEGSLIWLHTDELTQDLVCQAAYHVWLDRFQVEQQLRLGEGVAGQAAQSGSGIIVSSITADLLSAPDVNALGSGTVHSLLAVPLVTNDSQIGVLEFVNKMRGAFSIEDQELAESLAVAVADAINNTRLIESMQHQIDDLQTRNEDLDAFAHSVAHDLQNPLNQIVGFAELLRFKLDDLAAEERLYVVNALTTSANKMSSIIQELLLLASVRKLEVSLEPLQMQDIVSNAIQRLEHMLADHKVELVLPDEWPPVLGYAPWVEEVWENYLSNAIKYGGSPPRVELGGADQLNGRVQFWVRDNGNGFPPEVEDQLFAPFTQIKQQVHDAHAEGHGLGLSIVRKIVEKLGGEVAAECIQGQGSVFSFTLPALREPQK